MKARSSIRALLALLLSAAASVRAQSVLQPPTATPGSRTFVDPILVSLESGTPAASILFDTVDVNSNAAWDSTTARLYAGPVKISASKQLRAQSFLEVGGIRSYSPVGKYQYILDRPPAVSLVSPTTGAILRRTTTYSLSAQASDPDAEAITVTFQYQVGVTSTWVDIGAATAAPYAVNWTPDVSSRHLLRAVAVDIHGAKAVSEAVEVTVTEPNMPPTNVVLTAPAEGASFASGQDIAMSAIAEDQDQLGRGITKVEFYHEDTLIGTATTETYSVTWKGGPPGSHLLRAKAYDNHTPPATAVSPNVRVTIRPPNGRPAITGLTATPPGPLVAQAATTLNATATDPDGSVARVAFYDNGSLLGQDVTSPFAWQAAGLGVGTHAFTARAYDDVGDSSDISAAVRVTVNANQPPVANAGPDTILVQPANTVALNGSGSRDPEGGGLAYLWSGPAGVTFSNPAAANPTATLPGTGAFTLILTVTDRNTPSASDTDLVVVSLHARPAFTGKLADSATVGSPYSYTLSATGYPAPTFTVGALPAGITRSGNILSGTPTGPGGNAAIAITAANSAGSDPRTLALTVRQAPAITQDLVDAYSVQERSRVTFTIAASGFPPPAYQWQKVPVTGNPIPVGGNSSTLVLDTVSLSSAGNYRVVVTNGVGAGAVSKVCRLDVAAMIRIGSQPLPVTAMAGHPATFKVGATGAPPLLYQWFRGSTSLGPPAAKDSNLVLGAVKLSDNGLYRVRITNSWNDSTRGLWSDTARLTVNLPKIDKPKASPAAPANYGQNGENLVITLATDTPSTVIRYTTDGTAPDSNTGLLYVPAAKPTFSGVTVNLRAKAFRSGYQESDLFAGTYTYVRPNVAAKPTAYPLSPVFPSTQAVSCTLSTEPANAVIRYTLNGSDPRISAYQTYSGPFPLTRTVTVTAYAVGPSGWTDSDTLIKTYTLDVPKPKAQMPAATPKGQSFTGQLLVSLAAIPDSAVILYTLDGSSPENSPTRKAYDKSKPIPITARTVLKAQTAPAGMLPSDILTETYVLVPGPITASPAPVDGNHVFDDSVTVRLSVTPDAPIYYTLNDSIPLDGQNRPVAEAYPYSGGIPLRATTTVTAMALADGTVPSAPFRFLYTKRGGALNTPLVTTSSGAYAFKDSLRINLSSTSGSTIRYTRDGSLPTAASKAFTGPFTIDTTETIQAIALQEGFQPSRVLYATFTLEADTPWASPRGGSYFSSQRVNLFARSRRTPIKYTTDGSLPGPWNGQDYVPGQGIYINSHTELKAVALAGGLPGPLRQESYRINREIDTLLQPGETCFLEGGYSLANPLASSSAVLVKQGSADVLDLPGFEHVQFRIVVSAAGPGNGTAAFPGLVLARSASENRGLYKAEPGGPIHFVSAEARITVAEPGTYFMGTDAMRPVITYKGESLDDSGYTVVRFKVEDNVHSLLYSTRRSDDPRLNVDYELVTAGSEREFRLRNGKGVLKSLLFQLSVTDFSNLSYFPSDGRTSLPLSQALAGIQASGFWRVGADAAKPHDLVGIPLNLDPPLKLRDLGDSRTGAVEAFIYVDAAEKFRRLGQDDALVPGQAYWLASRSRLTGIQRGSAILKGTGSEKFAVKLSHGWNQVANPHLDTLFWPIPKGRAGSFIGTPVKRLWEYDASDTSNPFVEQDVMAPWKGYYVYNSSGDTTVQLYNQPPSPPFAATAKRSAADPHETSLVLSFGDAQPVELAASPAGRDEAGWEDERLLPAIAAGHRLQAVRQGIGLSCDWIHFRQDAVLRWSVLPRPPAGAAEPAPLRVRSRILPEGYQAWAVSRARGMKFLLEEGRGLPVSGLPDDTLQVIAGPAAKLAGDPSLQGLPSAAPPLALRVLPAPGGPELLLDLPGRSRVRAALWTLRGTSLGELERDLPGGHYRFLYAADFRGRVARPGPGVHILRLEISAPGAGTAYITRKVVFKD